MRPAMTLLITLAALAAAQARANLIVNGSFETPIVTVGGFTTFPATSTAINGWTVVGVDSSITSGSFSQNGIAFQAQDGNQWLDAAGFNSNSSTSGVTQNVPTMVSAQYEISFYVGSALDNVSFFPTTIDLQIDGGPRVSYTNPAAPNNMLDWRKFTVPFTAINSSTTITLYNGGASNNFLSGLDNVSLVAVPEPSSLVGLLGLVSGCCAFCAASKRRRLENGR